MLSDIFKEAPSLLGRRFLINAAFPSLIFWGLVIAVAIAGQGDVVEAFKKWTKLDNILKTLQIIGFVVWVTLFSIILSSQLNTILRFYEGYWDFPLGRYFANKRKKWYQSRLKKLDFENQAKKLRRTLKLVDKALQQTSLQLSSQIQQPSPLLKFKAQLKLNKLHKQKKRLLQKQAELQQQHNQGKLYENIYLYYPLPTQPQEVMPTCLGNILKNAELYPFDRYDIDAVLIWPRLYNLFPERFIQTIAEARSSLDFMLVISTLSCIFALASGVYLVIVKASGWFFLLCLWGGLFLAWLAYRAALGSALLYAQQIKAGFDLYRHELLKQMRLELPKTPTEEIEVWGKIRQLLYSGNTQVLLIYKDTNISDSQNSP
ncbi:hypothetical protein [Nostoc sp. ChiVER01]|uniref:hypothetical protein n=1 Tax=Nostoc sp. ChiVER01 TaxID=3075382 RepID=UPI002AD5854C|nr:hypothetical protein [Nostoc sp. ChiVER01]MDZ8226730.1 hypothetical protein [Nostoc sp. ChiVER01]